MENPGYWNIAVQHHDEVEEAVFGDAETYPDWEDAMPRGVVGRIRYTSSDNSVTYMEGPERLRRNTQYAFIIFVFSVICTYNTGIVAADNTKETETPNHLYAHNLGNYPNPSSPLEPFDICEQDNRSDDSAGPAPNPQTFGEILATAFIEVTFGDGVTGICTAFFVEPGLLLTAAHCVTDSDHGGDASRIDIVPAARGLDTSGNVIAPFGWQRIYQQDIRYHSFYTEGYTVTWDVAGLRLPNRALWNQMMNGRSKEPRFRLLSNPTWGSVSAEIRSYPGDKPRATQWWQNTLDARVVIPHSRNDPHTFSHTLDTTGGASGAPIYRGGWGGQAVALGVHTKDSCSFDGRAVFLQPWRARWIIDNWNP